MLKNARLLGAVAMCTFVLALNGCSGKPLPKANRDTVVTIGSAATVKVFAFGDLNITFPTTVYMKLSAADPNALYNEPLALVEAEYRRDLAARTLEEGTTLVDYAWKAIGRDPDRYLICSDDRTTMTESDVNYGTGSGFVVSSDGAVVTCHHCVTGGPVAGYVNREILNGFISVIQTRIGGAPSEEVLAEVIQPIYFYLRDRVQTESVFKEARVLLPQTPWETNGYDALSKEDSDNELVSLFVPSSTELLKKWTWPCEVLVSGETWPGKDVAVLKIPVSNLLTVDVSEEEAPRPDSTVLCLGFPGKAVQEGSMTKGAQFKVILHAGQVGQTLPTTSGYDAIHTDADINHGDSGGPAFNESGVVIGLSVSGQEDAAGQNYLVPASVIQEKLIEAGVKPKSDQLNEDWRKALLLMQSGRFAEAKSLLEKIRIVQDSDYAEGKRIALIDKYIKESLPNKVNLFVERAIADCEKKQKTR
ncbi:MAG: trypsin-like peptidase domain-containing protein [Fimbriimonadaceae bacterium]